MSEGLGARLWARDATLWPAGSEAPDRLGWLDSPAWARAHLGDLRALAADADRDGVTAVVLCGMGGSSLAPETLARTLPGAARPLHVLDSTHPARVREVTAQIDPARTLFFVSSKSGGTVETVSFYRHFRSLVDDGARFVAITDPGSGLADLARDEGFRACLVNPPDIGGRFSALSFFGLAPVAAAGFDLEGVVASAERMVATCGPDVADADNPGVAMGLAWAAAQRQGADKVVIAPPPALEAFGPWAEQLIAESTGKRGTGLVPVVGEPDGPSGPDRVAGHVSGERPEDLGGEFLRFEIATVIAGARLEIDAFDQPDVEAAKIATRELLSSDEEIPIPDGDADAYRALVDGAGPPDYVCFQAFCAPSARVDAALDAERARLRAATGVATTAGYGPRFLHSTGQLHKGGPPSGRYVQIVEPAAEGEDLPIPGQTLTFGRLIAAQALGDSRVLADRGRRLVRLTLDRFLDLAGA